MKRMLSIYDRCVIMQVKLYQDVISNREVIAI